MKEKRNLISGAQHNTHTHSLFAELTFMGQQASKQVAADGGAVKNSNKKPFDDVDNIDRIILCFN